MWNTFFMLLNQFLQGGLNYSEILDVFILDDWINLLQFLLGIKVLLVYGFPTIWKETFNRKSLLKTPLRPYQAPLLPLWLLGTFSAQLTINSSPLLSKLPKLKISNIKYRAGLKIVQ